MLNSLISYAPYLHRNKRSEEQNMNVRIRRAISLPNVFMNRSDNESKMLKDNYTLEIAFIDENPISSLPLNLKKMYFHPKFKNLKDDTSIIGRFKFCKTYGLCRRICPRTKYATNKARLKARQRNEGSNNFVLISAKYIMEFYRWTQNYAFKQLLADEFLKSVAASATLFVIGAKLTQELNAWSLSKTINR